MKEEYRSRVYTDRPAYADFDSPEKFNAIMSIIAKRLKEHPNAICSYSGGADSDILLDLIERTRKTFPFLPEVKYAFFNTGLEMEATKRHVRETAEKYGVTITEYRPKVNIVQATRKYGVPFVSKIMSAGLSEWQNKNIPLTIADEYNNADDKIAKRAELKERYPHCESVINFLCCCNAEGEPRPNIQLVINSSRYMRDFIGEFVCYNNERFGCSSHDHNILSQQRKSCLTIDEIIDYCNGQDVYGWHISDLIIYDKPKELSKFIKPSERGCCNIPLCGKGCPYFMRGCDAAGIEDDCYAEFDTDEFEPIFRPPQSWMYCEAVNK